MPPEDPPEQISDEEIVRRIKAKDESVLRDLLAKYDPRISGYFNSKKDHREEWLSPYETEAFIKACNDLIDGKIHKYDPAKGEFGPWFFRVVVNTGINLWRRDHRPPRPPPKPLYDGIDLSGYTREQLMEMYNQCLECLSEQEGRIIEADLADPKRKADTAMLIAMLRDQFPNISPSAIFKARSQGRAKHHRCMAAKVADGGSQDE